MRYEFNKLNSTDFEKLIQALSKRVFGNGAISFGEGPDGGREATFEGIAPYPSELENWDGYWVVQAKFKTVTVPNEAVDFSWVQQQLIAELEKYETRKSPVFKPDNYILFTNVILTAAAGNGGSNKGR